MENVITEIANTDRAIGWMALTTYRCAEEQKWYPALASLFMLTEQVLRWAAGVDGEKKLKSVIERVANGNLISGDEAAVLHAMRNYRNGYMHSNFHGYAFEIDGMLYLVNDEETAEKLFSGLSEPCFRIVLKLLK